MDSPAAQPGTEGTIQTVACSPPAAPVGGRCERTATMQFVVVIATVAAVLAGAAQASLP